MRAKELLNEAVRVQISDPEAKKYLQQAAELLIKQLGISNNNVNVVFGVNLPKSGHNGLTAPAKDHPGTINVLISGGLERAELLRTLAHELVHAKQLDSGDMKIEYTDTGIQPYWKDKPVPLQYNRGSEWEAEAHAKEKDLARMIVSQIGNLQ